MQRDSERCAQIAFCILGRIAPLKRLHSDRDDLSGARLLADGIAFTKIRQQILEESVHALSARASRVGFGCSCNG